VTKEVPSHGAAPVEAAAAAGAGTGAGATPELAGDCFMVASRGTQELHWWPTSMEQGRRCVAARQTARAAGRPGRSWRKQPPTTTTCLGVVAPDAALARRAAWRRLPDNASSSSRRPRAVPEREGVREEEEEVLSCWLVGALPRELKRNAPCFSLFPRLLARLERERKREVKDSKRMSSSTLSSAPQLSPAAPSSLTFCSSICN
jgi:hypothetical protein